MELIAVGDIHGCARTLDALLERLAPSSDDHLVFIGDYIDRGPDSRAVIERLFELEQNYQCTFLRGNHEALMLDYLDGGDFRLWQANGATSTLQSYADASEGEVDISEAHVAFVRATEPFYETPGFFFVHGGLKPHLSIEENRGRFGEDVFLWERSHLQTNHLAWEKPVVCGHTPQPEPINRDKLIAIDTGCVYYTRPGLGRLTAVRLPEREFTTVEYEG